MAKRDFPKQIYVGIEIDDDKKFLVADKDYEGLAVQGDQREIAVYELVRVATVVNKSEVV